MVPWIPDRQKATALLHLNPRGSRSVGAEYLHYFIRETRHQSFSRRDQQQDEMLDYLKGLLAKALNSGQTVARRWFGFWPPQRPGTAWRRFCGMGWPTARPT